MRKFEIMTDSTANLPKMMIDVYGIHVLSMRIIVEGEEYPIYNKEEGVSLQQFYDMMREKKDMSTVTITVDQAYKETKEILLRGRDILYIGFSSALSESFDSVCQAFSELQKEFPDRKLYAVDSLAAALGEGLFVKYVVEMREEGKEIDEVYHWALQNRLYFCHEFTVEDLFYLKRGGRISSTMALLGSTLSIRPILYVDDKGRLVNLGAARGRRSSLDNLVDQMKKYAIAPENQTIYINHGDCLEDAEYVADRIRAEMGVKDIMIQVLDPVIGVHAGPGTVAVFYYGEHRRKRIAGDFHTHIFIVNPYSGGQTFTDELRKQLDEIEGLNYYIFTTRYPGHEKELVKQILNMFEGEKLRFYCCGGSGTMRNIMNGFDDISDLLSLRPDQRLFESVRGGSGAV